MKKLKNRLSRILTQNVGFTLIEIFFITTILAVIFPAVFTIVYSIMQQQLKIYRVVETKQQGDYIREFMKTKIMQDAQWIVDSDDNFVCNSTGQIYSSTTGTDFILRGSGNENFYFYPLDSSLYYFDVKDSFESQLNTSKVRITDFSISCIKNQENIPLVQVSYTVTYNDPSATDIEGITSLPYLTRIQLRR